MPISSRLCVRLVAVPQRRAPRPRAVLRVERFAALLGVELFEGKADPSTSPDEGFPDDVSVVLRSAGPVPSRAQLGAVCPQASMMIMTVPRICRSTAGPTFPIVVLTRVVATDRMCWHCAAEMALSPLCPSGSMTILEPLSWIVRVRGTTWTTLGPPRRTLSAVITTAGLRRPASAPAGVPRSSSTTSPGVSIEPVNFVVSQRCGQVAPYSFLLEQARTAGHGVRQRLATPGRQVIEDVARGPAHSDRRRIAHTLRLASVDHLVYTCCSQSQMWTTNCRKWLVKTATTCVIT